MKRKIAVFTGNRAEYGLQYPILKAIVEHPGLDYVLLVSGAHLDPDFGETLEEIKHDGFDRVKEVKIDMDAGSLYATAQAIGSGVLSLSQTLNQLEPDMMVVYADRFEGLAAVLAASQMNIPTAHIEGGDLTEGGALDDSVRHAMTKLSHLHFTTNEQASNRVKAMGEEPWRVHTVGFPAIDLIQDGNYATHAELSESLSIDVNQPIVLFTQHSVTTEFSKAGIQILPSLTAMGKLAEGGVQVILTYPNNDAGGRMIIEKLIEFEKKKIKGIQLHQSLGRYRYHGLLSLARDDTQIACVGNSSSGIKETPVFGCPTVNIGSRQAGRLRGENVIDVPYDADKIITAIRKCFNDSIFRSQCHMTDNPYYIGDAGKKIADILASVKIDQQLIRKRMTIKGEVREGWFR